MVVENVVVGPLRPPTRSGSGLRSHDASLLLYVAATRPLSDVGKRVMSCGFESEGVVPPSIGNVRSDMARLSSAVLLATSVFVFGWPSNGQLATMCVNGGSCVLRKW